MVIFGVAEHDAANPGPYPQFADVMARHAEETARQSADCPGGGDAFCRAATVWSDTTRAWSGLSWRRKLDLVNSHFNRMPYSADEANWQQTDYWTTPHQFVQHGGDCEDYAIAKYFALRQLGFDADSLRIVIAVDERRRVLHAVLVVHVQGETFLLDSLQPDVGTPEDATQYTPLMSLNEHGRWYFFEARGAANLALSPE